MKNTTKPTYTYTGYVCIHDLDPLIYDSTVYLSETGPALAYELERFYGKKVSIRYWVSDKKVTKEEAESAWIAKTMGILEHKELANSGLFAGLKSEEIEYSEYTRDTYTENDIIAVPWEEVEKEKAQTIRWRWSRESPRIKYKKVGHDLMSELRGHQGKYVILEVEEV
jgi:hypothetical protein